ncbi:Rrf2 family transcriptional regulator [Lacibacterium aquatile]|uniref:Rrf2 family transcriptional regulator n=1 Tax=Lacibacterium aquatile TaxID=1168082 RepID=A0ABW5DVK8_9PROT
MAGRSSSRFAVAVHALAVIAKEKAYAEKQGDHTSKCDAPSCSDWIARSVGTNPVVIRRLLGTLREAGLVSSIAGPKGGFVLGRPAPQIRLGEVYRLVEPDGAFALHDGTNQDCMVGKTMCGTLEVITDQANAALAADLDRWTLADVLTQVLEAAE